MVLSIETSTFDINHRYGTTINKNHSSDFKVLQLGPSLVAYYWLGWCVYHSGVVHRREVTINQGKGVFTKQN